MTNRLPRSYQRHAIRSHQAITRPRLPRSAATAMMGTAWRGPNITTRIGMSTMDEPVPTTPPSVPASRPAAMSSA